MTESRRLPASHEDEALVRDRQIDALLEDGLDRYFAGRYDDAIHLWTRVLFLDRSHARARAYIDRARTAQAELQRRSDELLHATRDLLEQGQTDAARKLLAEATVATVDEVQAAALRVRLERLEQLRSVAAPAPPARTPVQTGPDWRRPPRSRFALITGLGIAGAVALAGVLYVISGNAPANRPGAASTQRAQAALPTLTTSDVALIRARTAAARGRLSEALRHLDRVSPDSPNRPAADQFRNEILQLLMASVRSSSATASTELVRR
jgi:hypothetical protein